MDAFLELDTSRRGTIRLHELRDVLSRFDIPDQALGVQLVAVGTGGTHPVEPIRGIVGTGNASIGIFFHYFPVKLMIFWDDLGGYRQLWILPTCGYMMRLHGLQLRGKIVAKMDKDGQNVVHMFERWRYRNLQNRFIAFDF